MAGIPRRLELWGGVECTIARLGEGTRDQVVETGHRDRPGDLDLLAGLGLRTLRYPVLWESVQPSLGAAPDWTWHDARLARFRELRIRPIAGLVHHGSGPRGTHLLDPAFPRRLAAYAGMVARRYPWLDLYTPVNEPLTTARFSALYGHWYPHERGYGPFLRALVHQCRATVLAMRAIRRVNPRARLVQTEDLGRTFSTPGLGYQAEHENERRWLTFDLLFGRVDRHHPWRRIFRDHGISDRELAVFEDREGVPAIVGINHYLTSERFLDDRIHLYPEHLRGGNGRESYADVEAVRVALAPGALGPAARLREAWARYRTPLAITEAHHGCTREEQLRWLAEVWRAAETLRRERVDIRAVTAWALLGARDWNSLLTRRDGIYEPGAFDVRGPTPRPTALAAAVAGLARTGRYAHPVLDVAGWWRRPGRYHRPAARPERAPPRARAILLVDDGSALGRGLERIAAARGLVLRRVEPRQLAGRRASELARDAWAVVEIGAAAGRRARRLVAAGGELLPRLVIDPDPNGALGGKDRTLMVRTGHVFGPWEPDGLVSGLLDDLAAERRVTRPGQRVIPAYLPDLLHVALDLLIDGETGCWSLESSDPITRRDLADALAARVGLGPVRASSAIPVAAPGAAGRGGHLMPPLGSALDRYVGEIGVAWRIPAQHAAVRAVG